MTLPNSANLLEQIGRHLDISPSDFEQARSRFTAVQNHLSSGQYVSGSTPSIYLQGSFRLGTVVKPYRNGADGDFDIDQVCELTLPVPNPEPGRLKHDIGNRLKENSNYKRMLDEEGQRCWTIEYASQENHAGFHIDVLPAIRARGSHDGRIDITDKSAQTYGWSASNPSGYYYWFKSKNRISQDLSTTRSLEIFANNPGLYERVEDVPIQLIRSPLQRAIQIMKRHRDVYFSETNSKPISIIITTIAAHLYEDMDIVDVIETFCDYIVRRHHILIRDGQLEPDGIFDFTDEEWQIRNPVDVSSGHATIENFADKWNEDSALPAAFFDWVYRLQRDISGYSNSGVSDDLNLQITRFGEGSAFPTIVKQQREAAVQQGTGFTDTLLNLIHMGIDSVVDWDYVAQSAQENLNNATMPKDVDVARVNYYQVAKHRGRGLRQDAIDDIQRILKNHPEDSAFVMCCNILLGTVRPEMISTCISDRGNLDTLRWPILRLVRRESLLPETYS